MIYSKKNDTSFGALFIWLLAKKKTDRTNIIATNFVWEQLKKDFKKT